MKYILFFMALSFPFLSHASSLCSKEAILEACANDDVSDASMAMDCYKGSKGYAGISCSKTCKEKLKYCVDNEKVNLTDLFSE